MCFLCVIGESLQRQVLAEFKRNMNTTALEARVSIPEYDNTLLTFNTAFQAPSADSPSNFKNWNLKLERGSKTQYELGVNVSHVCRSVKNFCMKISAIVYDKISYIQRGTVSCRMVRGFTSNIRGPRIKPRLGHRKEVNPVRS